MAELPLTMPKMSMTMEEGTMVSWLKSVGDSVRSGEPICEVATDKVDMEVESPFDGVLARIVADIDEVIAVGEPIGYITTEDDDLLGGLFDEPAAEEPLPEAEAATSAESQQHADSDAGAGASEQVGANRGWVAAVPAARALANERGLAIENVTPTGPWGAVTVRDVEASTPGNAGQASKATPSTSSSANPVIDDVLSERVDPPLPGAPVLQTSAPSAPSAPGASSASSAPSAPSAPSASSASSAPSSPEPTASKAAPSAPQRSPEEARKLRTRMMVAKVMSQSATVPQFTANIRLDLEHLAPIRKTQLGGASWTAILVRAQAKALAATPALLGQWGENGPESLDHIGIAVAVDSPNGLLAPVFIDPHKGTLAELVESISATVAQTREGTLPPQRLGRGTSVFSNLGGFGVESFNALLTPPQATALSAGAVQREVVVNADGSFGPRLGCRVGITVDHRLADGADAARFLQNLVAALEEPSALL
ncbi:2-oxo acid dehydrogenase subunit E2 [Humidisolicoccus flavus]|uniref:2-oxo acid dehydrogenase subunit E2 n=1 Tax=Humidisolicoccus flavus TaxID=3111414 RepID=UPI003249067C